MKRKLEISQADIKKEDTAKRLALPLIATTFFATNLVNSEISFSDFYKQTDNWMDSVENPLDHLKKFYANYYIDNTPDYTKIQKNVLDDKKAQDLFKNLFKIPFSSHRRIYTEDLQYIEENFGNQIIAHGVEEMKGGMYNLLLMCISNQVRAPSNNWGNFINGIPNISPVAHGPYYLIYSSPLNQKETSPHNPSLDNIDHIMLPFQQNIDILKEKLDEMVRVNLITPEAQDKFIGKLITYNEFCKALKASCVCSDDQIRVAYENKSLSSLADSYQNDEFLDDDDESWLLLK